VTPIGWKSRDGELIDGNSPGRTRSAWPISWGTSTPLLQRCVDWRQGLRERCAPERIVDRRHRDDNPGQFREGQYVRPGDFRSRELPGGLRKSAHRGRIISVR
jgi:hypothetical protein